MVLRCILVPTAADVDVTHRLNTALKLSRRLRAHINVLFVTPDATRSLRALPQAAIAAGVTISSLERAERKAADIGKAALEDWCHTVGVPMNQSSRELDATFATWSVATGDLDTIVALTGRVNDLIVVDRPDNATPFAETVFDAAVFSSARPVLMVPGEVRDSPMRHVAIGWNGSLESARLIGQSITMLHEAEEVSVIKVRNRSQEDMGLADLTAYLRWHGIEAGSFEAEAADDTSIGAALLAQADHIEASMLMMGAYTHSRIRQFLLGGVTRHVIAHTRIPVMMAH